MSEGRPDASPWGEVVLEPEESHVVELGTLGLTVKRTAKEVWVQARRGTAEPEDWIRWPMAPHRGLEVRRAVPDRLLVVSHEYLYHLPPDAETHIYVRIPLFVQVVITGAPDDLIVADLPSIVLSDTWWGTFIEGELAYWLTTTARITLSDDLFLPHLAMCPFRLVNRAPDALPLDRFAVRVPHLSLFSERERNWTDEVVVRYEDSPEGSEIRFRGEPPPEAPQARLIAQPRTPSERGFQARTFDRLRSLSNLGL